MARCSATTKKGSQCRLKALEGSSFCAVHISPDPAAPTVREAIEAWPVEARVGVVASGGLSHFVVDEEIDQLALEGMKEHNLDKLSALPRERLNAGSSEIRNWISASGAAEHLEMELIDYVPCYRSPAGTGCGMGFATWS